MSDGDDASAEGRISLPTFLREHRDQIIDQWSRAAGELPGARELSHARLIDFVPPLLDSIIESIRRVGKEEEYVLPGDEAGKHALDRLEEGYDLTEVVIELCLLRDTILDMWPGTSGATRKEREEERVLNRAIDHSIIVAASRFTATRDRILRVLDRISAAAFSVTDLDELLHMLVRTFCEEVPAVDTAAILLREGDRLVLHAAAGLQREMEGGYSLAIGEGFSGQVAERKKPIHLRDACEDPLVKSPTLRERGVRALYGVPLLDGEEVIGVAHIGSTTTAEFSEQDRLLLESMASRATIAIFRQLTHRTAQQRTAQLEQIRRRLAFLSGTGEVLGASLDLQETLSSVARLAVPDVADWCLVDLFGDDGRVREPVAVCHRDENKIELVRELRRRFPPAEGSGVVVVSRSGEPLLAPRITPDVLRERIADAEHRRLVEQIGLRSYLCVPLRSGDKTIGAISLAQAESEREFDDEDLELAMEFARRTAMAVENAQLHDETERAVQLRDQILGVVSHDLRSPISTIDLACHLLLTSPEIAELAAEKKQIEMIRRNAQHAARLINDLLDVSVIQSGRLSFELEGCEVRSIVDEAVTAHVPLADEKGIEIRHSIDVTEEKIQCDRQRLQQVLSNIVGNAVKFSSQGGVVELSAERRGDEVLLCVADDGPGISPEMSEHIFDLYWKGAAEGSGTGLGLFIAKGIVESHGGRIWVDSTPGQGSAFYVALPLSE